MDNKDQESYLFATRIVGDFGATIAIPALVFALIGDYLDDKYQHGPIFLIIGFILAAIISGISIFKKVKKYGEEYNRLTSSKK